MITFLEGEVVLKTEKFLIVGVGGVGYKVSTNLETIKNLPQNNGKVKLWTHLYVRENALELYGFLNYAELEFFEILIQVSGIGPKSALAILEVAPTDTLKHAIASGETSYLTRVSGVGRKIAEKIVLELRDKLSSKDAAAFRLKEDEEVFEALKSLGYSTTQIREALRKIPSETKKTQDRIKEAMRIINKTG